MNCHANCPAMPRTLRTTGTWLMALLTVLAAPSLGFSAPGTARKPNILLVMTDDQGFGDIGVQGNDKIKTPHLDRFAREGIELSRFYCSPVCAPTRASLMTGRYYYRSGVVHTSRGGAKMHGEEVTIAERLKRLGYTSGIFGKWHLGDTYPMRPQDQGFDEVLVHKSGGIDQTPDKPNSYFDPILWHNGRRVKSRGYCTDVFTDAAIEFIEANRAKPFFVYLPTNAPHTPLYVAQEYSDPYVEMGLDETTAKVYGMVTNIDDNFGRLLAKLESLGLREDTVIIFFGDNGPQQKRYTAGLRGRKSWTYEGGVRVGAYFQWPARLAGGRKNDSIAAHIDIAPTLLAMAGETALEGPALDGVNLLPLLSGHTAGLAERTLYFQCHRGLTPKRYQNCAAISARFKMVGYPGTFGQEDLDTSGDPLLELYDVAADPGEENNLAGEKPDVLARLRADYDAWFDDVSGTRGFTPGVIHLGSEAENPVRLCRYQDGTYRDGVPHGWSVRVERSGRYRFTINRGPLAGPGKLCVTWNGRTMGRPVGADSSSAEFELSDAVGVIDVWFQEEGQERVVFSANVPDGDVDVERLE